VPIVRLNIGGREFITTSQTLLDGPHSPPKECNFFHALINGKTGTARLQGDAFFIDRDGKYFETILEYLRTGDVVIPDGLAVSSVVREAEFYGVSFPLSEDSPQLLFINDDWLSQKRNEQLSHHLCQGSDELLTAVMSDFKQCAVHGGHIQSRVFMREPRDKNGVTAAATKMAKRAQALHETQDIRSAIELQAQKFYTNAATDREINGAFFRLLDERTSREILIDRCRHSALTVEVHPLAIRINWKGTESFWTVGYYFLHCPEKA